jgi:hypothetical protein
MFCPYRDRTPDCPARELVTFQNVTYPYGKEPYIETYAMQKYWPIDKANKTTYHMTESNSHFLEFSHEFSGMFLSR